MLTIAISVCACNVLHCSIHVLLTPKIITTHTHTLSLYFKMNAIECRNNASTTNWLAMKLLWFRSAIIWADRFVFRIKCVICVEYVLEARIEFDRTNAQWSFVRFVNHRLYLNVWCAMWNKRQKHNSRKKTESERKGHSQKILTWKNWKHAHKLPEKLWAKRVLPQ